MLPATGLQVAAAVPGRGGSREDRRLEHDMLPRCYYYHADIFTNASCCCTTCCSIVMHTHKPSVANVMLP